MGVSSCQILFTGLAWTMHRRIPAAPRRRRRTSRRSPVRPPSPRLLGRDLGLETAGSLPEALPGVRQDEPPRAFVARFGGLDEGLDEGAVLLLLPRGAGAEHGSDDAVEVPELHPLTSRRTERKLELYIIVDIFLGVVEVVVRWSHDL